MVQSTQTSLDKEKADNDRLFQQKEGFTRAFEKVRSNFETVEQTLSCLSCLEFLSDKALTLICGHSICQKVSFNSHHLIYLVLYSASTCTVILRAKTHWYSVKNARLRRKIRSCATLSSSKYFAARCTSKKSHLNKSANFSQPNDLQPLKKFLTIISFT